MSDIVIAWDTVNGRGQLVLDQASGLLETGNDMATAVIISLFSDRLADVGDELPNPDGDRRGWYVDGFLQLLNPGDLMGSRLWLLSRAKSDKNLPMTARGYIDEALQWMIDDGVVASISTNCFFIRGDQSRLGAVIQLYRQNGQLEASLNFDWAWQQITPAPATLAA